MTEKFCAQKITKTTQRGYSVLAFLYSPEMQSFTSTTLWLTHRRAPELRGTHPAHGAGTRSHEKPAERGDGVPEAPSKYQMALRIRKGNEREGTNGTLACCIYMSCLLFFFFFGFV